MAIVFGHEIYICNPNLGKIQIFIPKSTEGEGGPPVWELSLEKKLFFSASLSLEIETETKSLKSLWLTISREVHNYQESFAY